MSTQERSRKAVQIMSVCAWLILLIGVIPSWFGLDLPIPTDVGVIMGIALFTLIQGAAWVLAKRSGYSEYVAQRRPAPTATGPTGVGGVLWFPIIGLIALGPLAQLSSTLKSLTAAENLHPTLVNASAWANYKMGLWIMVAVASVISIVAGYLLLNVRRPIAPRVAVWAFWLRGPVAGLADLVLLHMMLDVPLTLGFVDATVTASFIGSLLMCTIWTLYFKFSKRVHNTYFGYVAPAERVMPTEKTA